MIVIEKNAGEKIPFEVDGAKICFDDDLTINLAKREEDWDVHIDVCHDEGGALVLGAAAGRSYVAEIDIPARKYIQTGAPAQDEPHDDGDSKSVEPMPFSMDNVTLSLWALT